MSVKLLTKHHLEFVSLKGGCTGSSESTLVKMPHCWKSHLAAQMSKEVNEEYSQITDAAFCSMETIKARPATWMHQYYS